MRLIVRDFERRKSFPARLAAERRGFLFAIGISFKFTGMK
jgi:hypothetical protein